MIAHCEYNGKGKSTLYLNNDEVNEIVSHIHQRELWKK